MFDTSKYQIQDINSLYKWHRNYGGLQRRYFKEDFKIRREQQIEDFIRLNDFGKVYLEKDNNVLRSLSEIETTNIKDADITIITDQKFSRYPCREIISQIRKRLIDCPRLYLCLNRYYINIDNSYHDHTLDDNPNKAIGQWLKKSLKEFKIIDLSLDYDDDGSWFTWVIPDRHFFIERRT